MPSVSKDAGTDYALLRETKEDCVNSLETASSYDPGDFPPRKQRRWAAWLRENYLKLAQLLVLINISILLTIDVTATLAARVKASNDCGHNKHGESQTRPSDQPSN